jgi:CHAT domain-containing protein
MFKNHQFFLALVVFASTGAALSQQEIATLEPGKVLTRELSAGQEHIYKIALTEKQYASIIVEQIGIDIEMQLLGFQGEHILTLDEEYRNHGQEKMEIVAGTSASYRVKIRPSSQSASPGHFEIRLAEVRSSTEADQLMNNARLLEADFNRFSLAGNYVDARKSIEQALDISENTLGKEHPYVATLLYHLAIYYDDKQDSARSISCFERALAIRTKSLGEEHPLTIDAMQWLAYAYYHANENAKAQLLADRALQLSQKVLGPNHLLVARCLHILGYITGDRVKSEELLGQALIVAEKTVGPEDRFVATALNSLGILNTDKGDLERAESFLLRAKKIKDNSLGPENISHVVSLTNLGVIARQKKDYILAEENYRKAIAIVEKAFGPENPRLAQVLNNIGNIYRAKGDYTKALEAHLRVLRIWENTKGPYHPMTLLCLGNIAKTYAADGNLTEAINFQSRVDSVIERNIELNLAFGPERQKLFYLNRMSERTDRTISLNAQLAKNDPAASALSALTILQRKGRVLDAMSENFASLRQRSTAEEQTLLTQFNDTTEQLARLVLNGPQTKTFEEYQKTISKLEEKKERLEAEISRRSAEFQAQSQQVTLEAIQALIPANTALVEFAVYRPFDPKAESNTEAYKEAHYIAYVLHQRGEVLWHDIGDVETIDTAIDSFRQALGNSERKDVKELARALDEKIMQPLRPMLGNATQLLISPDGALNLIPFEALVDNQNRYLLENYLCSYLTSGRDLLRLQFERQSKTAPVLVANPMFGGRNPAITDVQQQELSKNIRSVTTASDLSKVYFAPLSGTGEEARAIKTFFKEATVLTGKEATESKLKQISAPRILHIATHGFFLTDVSSSKNPDTTIQNPLLRSGLAFAGANARQSGNDDGILTALEASGLNLWGSKLVTLSACDTGLGPVKNGEGVYGLRRAFFLSGTESLVMSLWSVSDYAGREMMTNYYKNLKQGLGRAEALRAVKLKMMKDSRRAHPFFWASFIQSGQWLPL